MNLAAHPTKIRLLCLPPSITRPMSEPQALAKPSPQPSSQFDPDSAISPSKPGSASTRREPRRFNLEKLSPDHGSRSVDHGPRCLDLGPRTRVQGSGFRVQARFKYIDYDRPSVTTAGAERYAFPKSGNERSNNSGHKKAAPNLRWL